MVIWQSDTLTRLLQSVVVVPLTTNLDRAKLAGTAVIGASPLGPPEDSVALAFQVRAIPKAALQGKIRDLDHEALRTKPFSPEQQKVLAQLRWGRSIQEAITSIGDSRAAWASAAPSPSEPAGRNPQLALRSPTFILGKTP